ncbi:phosphatidylinositol phosphate synthase [Jonesia denitrificans]|uniref:Phosphatidylinositol phosphate synthase n=1 Tax=Jonesia denitrificans (strain ATCC 14870 / DSM 20603 / BCRC 15368 / CIP 55.134 / JCM 11481 / NBRC 15587 / NCTC 10816 / Prevot 55134) TaxID=471856 RepID=C7R4H5_JONDD|nr:CDP-alcohol phosphatidyltransferase family protein [Jonesia denitrificans]ACV09032.1 CDP-alcohol phosphatidyltransferase [Jonesia denitrificans DSM 20603]ASE09675.1 CDP-alcohol phosphatidyltransferase family protein [Jonesia denitrificans]QXB44214.1 CDP-alcohol phosphatidyltransferase family protein [Jonesia denitrificans]SQH21160.1 CDP-diacylglycerol--inositol 3-phosphatidyltransferase [Jonesia denitrificans]
MLNGLRGVMATIFTPIARFLLRLRISPDAVTITGTFLVIATALWLLPTGRLVAGALVIGLFVFTDSLDGTMARLSGRSGPWGAFLDSTLDRLADGALFIGLALYFAWHAPAAQHLGTLAALACLLLGLCVSYARARAEGLGLDGNVGIAERPERLLVSLLATLITGLTANPSILAWALVVLAALSAITLIQRISHVHHQTRPQETHS